MHMQGPLWLPGGQPGADPRNFVPLTLIYTARGIQCRVWDMLCLPAGSGGSIARGGM